MVIEFGLALLFAIIWGASENRYWVESNWYDASLIFNHFKQYHLIMIIIDLLVAGMGCGGSYILFFFLLAWFPLVLDIVWWVIRWLDFEIDSGKAQVYYHEPNQWHLKSDWDNAPIPWIRNGEVVWIKPDLIYGMYWWWWVLGILCGTLAIIKVII